MSTRTWTAKVFVNSSVGTINPVVQANTLRGAEQQINSLHGPVEQIVNLREINPNRAASASSSSGGGGCLSILGLGALLAIGAVSGVFDGGEGSSPSESPQSPVMEKVETYQAPATTYEPVETYEAPAAPPRRKSLMEHLDEVAAPVVEESAPVESFSCVDENFMPC